MGDFLRWIVKDINSEKMDTMVDNGLEPKDVNKYISNKAREMFFKLQDEIEFSKCLDCTAYPINSIK